jgi:hypothetical protein
MALAHIILKVFKIVFLCFISSQPPEVKMTKGESVEITEEKTDEKDTEIKIKAEDLIKTEGQTETNAESNSK